MLNGSQNRVNLPRYLGVLQSARPVKSCPFNRPGKEKSHVR